MSEEKNKGWYKHGWGLVAAILFFPLFILWYTWTKANWSKNAKIALSAFIAIILILAVVSGNSSKEKSKQTPQNQPAATSQPAKKVDTTPKPKAKYEGVITSATAVNPATYRFNASVKNVGDAAGKFKCTVRAQDDSGTYKGFDLFEDEGGELKPGETREWNGVLTITKEGANYVTQQTITCS